MKCEFDPRTLKGQPIGMFHCPKCGEMVLAGCKHPDYENDNDLIDDDSYDYEYEYDNDMMDDLEAEQEEIYQKKQEDKE